MEYAIGTKFKTRGKHPRLCEVTDILKTFNSKGELVRTRYQAQHRLGTQYVVEHDVVAATIAMGLDTSTLSSNFVRAEDDEASQ